jgi:(2Fe-2S) ferredoxin
MCRDCCCGTARKHPGVDHEGLVTRMAQLTAGFADVTVSACLLACERSNVVVVSPSPEGRLAGARPVWFQRVLDDATVESIAAWLRQGGPGLRELPLRLRQLETTPSGLAVALVDDGVP